MSGKVEGAGIRSGETLLAGRRPRLARASARAGLLPVIAGVRAALRRDLRILAYHRVLDSIEPADFSFDPELISASSDAFRRQLSIVKRRFAPMRFDELIDCLDRRRPVPRRAVLITFDDGYADNAVVALPLLQRFGLKATFFIATAFLDGGRMWNDDVIEAMRFAMSGSEVL